MKVASWNIEGRLTRFAERGKRGSPEQILGEIEKIDADVLFLAEAFDQARPIEPEILEKLLSLGYAVNETPYDDSGSRVYAATKNPHMMFLSRMPVDYTNEIRLGSIRNAQVTQVVDGNSNQPIRIFGIHLDDRSEENRLKQLEDLIPLINSSDLPTIVMGDFNAMYRESAQANFLRNPAVLEAINRWPDPRSKDILSRLSEMAIGDTMSRITNETNLKDVDSKMRPTITPKLRGQEWMPSIRMVQIDHILISPQLRTSDFSITGDGGSDHRAISATIAHLENSA